MHPARRIFCGSLVIAAALACAGEGTGPNGNGAVSFANDVQPIFSNRCALSGCHVAPSPPEGMNLSAGQAYANIVNVTSSQVPAMVRVKPGDPEASYLVLKIEGRQAEVGGTGQRMPALGCCLSSAQIATIRSWISAGALNN